MPKDVFPNYPRTKDHMPDGDPVDRGTMSALTGRTPRAVAKWIERGILPPADGPWVSGPTWRRRTFLAWAYHYGFLEQDGQRLPLWEEGKRWTLQVPESTLVPVKEQPHRIADFLYGPD